ncbi:alpha/beta hydrolase [Corynebacterium glutamicum MT]|uniref:Alpha/beta hydrolase n=1 Tax=Corynebacterium glutamicum TaxID=1718 RepID=A0AB36IHE2_CORGT|nr:alpha/beta hydrolase [Corynebacterium glutamicum]AGN18818.1 esterase/lipase [Corynebacterium glutamicum SCgG1]AGN21841.1 esterase/lipase [Corynebacterium glutamicum SCgG2]EGV39208.1 alpha/beta hydrolase fold-3 domain-containing protein [Corynebacterium glutamicum S9114]EOA65049.1 alpha/beta hydrolase [Corynebacterium glutamicum MT]EPP41170.1 esterase/lipase [Corynebacterium glutamicum Z188]
MPLHPEIQKIVDTLPPTSTSPPIPETLREEEAQRIPAVQITDLNVEDAHVNGVPVRIYSPNMSAGVIVYFHGGAYFSGSIDTHDHVTRALAQATGHVVVSVGYRLAPEHPFPAGLNDCFAVYKWAVAQNLHKGGNVVVAGDSSGGSFAAVVAALAHDAGDSEITHQILYYPSVDLRFDQNRWPSLAENAEGCGLEYAGLKPFNSFYLEGVDASNPQASPILREDLSGLPPALIVTAGFDPLRDEGEGYGIRLQEAGVSTTLRRYANANHGFLVNFSWIPEFYDEFAQTADFLKV